MSLLIFAIILGIPTLGGILLGCYLFFSGESHAGGIGLSLASLIIGGGLIFLLLFYSFGTASGQRAWKDFHSNTNNGLERTITVFNISGEETTSYSGKFDIDVSPNENKILFDDENGKRHIIFYGAGQVTITEN